MTYGYTMEYCQLCNKTCNHHIYEQNGEYKKSCTECEKRAFFEDCLLDVD